MLNLLQGNALLALGAALTWGGGDFSGGMGVRAVGGSLRGALRIVVLSHLTSFTFLILFMSMGRLPMPQGAVLAWGVGAGVAGGLSITGFYIALSRGAMGTAAAVSGLLAAAIPAVVSMVAEGSPGVLRLLGFAIAGGAIWLIAAGPQIATAPGRGTTLLAIAAGAGFGLYFVGLKMAGAAGPLWAMTTARVGSLTICSLLLLGFSMKAGAEERVRVGWMAARWVLLTALLDTSGNMLFIAATRAGRLDVAAVLASLYPATTILLAAWRLNERPTGRQSLGMLVGAAAVVMITL